MERFIYYEITGFLLSSFVSMKLGNIKKYVSREKAIEVLENVLKEWKDTDGFKSSGECVNDNVDEDKLIGLVYRHQFVFKNRSGMFWEITYKVVKHIIVYEK